MISRRLRRQLGSRKAAQRKRTRARWRSEWITALTCATETIRRLWPEIPEHVLKGEP